MSPSLNASPAVSVNALMFTGGEVWSEDKQDAQASTILQTLAQSVSGLSGAKTSETTSQPVPDQNISTYVRAFEDMVCTVVKEERHLLSDEEFALLAVFAHLSYNARYLMVKLLLRKQETWHRLDNLKYESELGSLPAIIEAIDELSRAGSDPSDAVREEESEEQEVVDLTMAGSVTDSQEEQHQPTSVHAASLKPSDTKPLALVRSQREMDLKDLLECLRVDELKDVARQLKLKTNKKKEDLIKDLLGTSSSQSTLTNFACTASKGRSYHQSNLSFFKLKPQQERLKEIILRHIVRCVRVDEEFFCVIHRVNLVYFRLTQYTPGILVAALLTRFGKRAYPGYEHTRTINIWPTRQSLLDYEEVLVLEGRVDTLLAGNALPPSGTGVDRRTPVARSLLTPITPGNVNDRREVVDIGDQDSKSNVGSDNVRIRGARMVKDIFEQIYPRWENLVKTRGEEDGRPGGLERFHHGHILTRIVCKGSAALGILGEHERELNILEALLAQKRWRRGQRGRWHERRALILSVHLPKDEETTERALDAVIEGLRDPDTHLVYRPKLQRRLKKLESKLRIPMKERHMCNGILSEADEVEFEAVRLRHRASSLRLDRTGRCMDTPNQRNQDIKRYYSPAATSVKSESSPNAASSHRNSLSDILRGKSLWLGRNGEELTVEELALQCYEDQGFKGIHCETRVISMLFSFLFWDIIFTPIPGAFETPYQTAPLDIAEDSFYYSRKDLMEQRLAAIEAGKGADLVREVDAKHRASRTWCIGIQWDLFSSEDVVDIVKCIGGQALSVICRVLCEDYVFGTSGGPDLFLWNAEKGTCKFVEVKGPGDTLQENQRVWIDILLKAPVAVEICRIIEDGNEADKRPNARTPKSTRKNVKKTSQKGAGILVSSDDTLPRLLADPCMALEEQLAAHSLLGPITEETSSPLKRKASPYEVMTPTPSKRQRT